MLRVRLSNIEVISTLLGDVKRWHFEAFVICGIYSSGLKLYFAYLII